MPSGITHDRITLWVLPWIAGISYALTRNGELTLIMAGGFLFSGLMFGPDLDIYSLQYKRWGILRVIWLPYRLMLRHRSLFSHGPLIGTCIRLLYLFTIVAFLSIVLVGIAQLLWGFPWNWQQFTLHKLNLIQTKYYYEAVSLFWGLELGAMTHSLSDWLVSSYKYRRKKKGKIDKVN